MAIKQIDRQNLKVIEQAILAKLRESLGSDFGLEFNFKGGNYSRDGGNAILKLEIAVKNSDGSVNSRDAENFKARATLYGLKPEQLGATFTVGRESFKVSGLVPTQRVKPILADRVRDGKTFKFTADEVAAYLGGAPARNTVAGLLAATLPATAAERQEIERQIADMRSNAPENYYADGEHKANGYSEKQIHDMHFDSLLRQLRSGTKLPLMNLFQTKK